MKHVFATLALATVALVPAFGFADVPPPDTEGCATKAPNDVCVSDDKKTNGVCVATKCSRSVSVGAPSPRDAAADGAASGVPAETILYDCLTCVVGSAGSSGTSATKSGCALSATRSGATVLGVGVAFAWLLSRRKRNR